MRYVIAIATTIILAFTLTPKLAQADLPAPLSSCEEIASEEPPLDMSISVPTFSQWGQPAWSSKKMLPSQLTLATHGCFIASLTMIINNYAIFLDPGQVLDKLINVNGLSGDGQLNYNAVSRLWPQLTFIERGYTTNHPFNNVQKTDIVTSINWIKAHVRHGFPLILAVDNQGNDEVPDHAVVLYDAPDDLNLWKIKDPDGGKDIFFKDKYGDPMKKVYGWVAIAGSPLTFPDNGQPTVGACLAKLGQAKRGINKDMNLTEAFSVLLR